MNKRQFNSSMELIVTALKERGYDPYVQLLGYINLRNPNYITSYKGARKLIQELDFEQVQTYVKDHIK